MEAVNKILVGRWLTDVWGEKCNLSAIDRLAAPNMRLRHSLHPPRRGREEVKAFMVGLRQAFPDFVLRSVDELIAEKDRVVVHWEITGTHSGPVYSDLLMGTLTEATGRKLQFGGMSVLKLANGQITEEVGLDDGVTALGQLGFIPVAAIPGF